MKTNLKKLTVSALFIALGTVLSELIPSIQLPFGGSITLFSMVPVCLIAILFGTKWGVGGATVYGVVQMLFGLNNLSYATWWGAAVVIIAFDYIIAYAVLGFSGVFKNATKNKLLNIILGVIFAVALRYLCHIITGVTVWREISEFSSALWFSITYNGSYMLPEIIITPLLIGVLYKTNVLKRIS